MSKNVNNAGIFSALFISILIITFCAGCSEQSDTSTTTPVPTITAIQPKFVEGDIISKTAISTDVFFLILKYDSLSDKYERAFLYKKSDGSWFRSNDKSEFADRILMETLYPATVGHVNSISQISIETPSKNILPTSTSIPTSTLTLTSAPTSSLTLSPATTVTETQTLTLQGDPIVGSWIFTSPYDENGTRINVVCTHQFESSGNFSHSCVSPNEPAQAPDTGQWENLGDNAYVIMYPDENNPELPYGFYDGFYYNLSYNPEFDTLTISEEMTNETIVLTRVKNT